MFFYTTATGKTITPET
uniref:Uncharacterized protein n=1 Tax=Arundo donax TaxID=35708 RepID=A0A0A9BEK3_ARUDO